MNRIKEMKMDWNYYIYIKGWETNTTPMITFKISDDFEKLREEWIKKLKDSIKI
jgi:hypothetical protein